MQARAIANHAALTFVLAVSNALKASDSASAASLQVRTADATADINASSGRNLELIPSRLVLRVRGPARGIYVVVVQWTLGDWSSGFLRLVPIHSAPGQPQNEGGCCNARGPYVGRMGNNACASLSAKLDDDGQRDLQAHA